MSAIARIDISHHRLPLDPPFPASWDPRPRTHFPATIVRVTDSDGRVGVGSGDAMYGFSDYQQHFIGQDPLDLERHHAVLSNIDFHAGRPWPLDVALWDLAGKIQDRPVWDLVGGRHQRVRAYASTGVHRPVAEMVQVALRARSLGFPALKVRFGRPDLAEDLAVVAAIKDAVGDTLELMVDCNQGWRMPWDTRLAVDRRPRHRGGSGPGRNRRVLDGGAAPPGGLRRPCRAAPADRHPHRRRRDDPRALRAAPDARARWPGRLPARLRLHGWDHRPAGPGRLRSRRAGHVFTPHTWGNGIGLMANLHLTAGAADAPFIEFPFDPPEWTTARRDFPLTETIEIDGDGWITLSDAPGLGLQLDEATLAATRSDHATFG